MTARSASASCARRRGIRQVRRADRIVALIPIEEGQRGEGRRTYVDVEGRTKLRLPSRAAAVAYAARAALL